MTPTPLRLGISRCLLGEAVRFDGGHKRDGFLTDVLGHYVEWVPVCPEVEAGLGTPREATQLQALHDHRTSVVEPPDISSFAEAEMGSFSRIARTAEESFLVIAFCKRAWVDGMTPADSMMPR